MINIKNKNKEFSRYVLKKTYNGDVSFMEAILQYCRENDIEPQAVVPMLTKSMKEKLEGEAIDLNLVKSTTHKLPIGD